MDAIRKKMQSLKSETDNLLKQIDKYESVKEEAETASNRYDCDIRDLGKKITNYEGEFDETNDKLVKSLETLEEKEKAYKTFRHNFGRKLPKKKKKPRRRKKDIQNLL